MTLSERLYIVNNIYVLYPRVKEIFSAIDYCHHFSNLKDEPECLFLKGETGTGKTTIFRSYAQGYPRQETPIGTVVPGSYAVLSDPVKNKRSLNYLLRNINKIILIRAY